MDGFDSRSPTASGAPRRGEEKTLFFVYPLRTGILPETQILVRSITH